MQGKRTEITPEKVIEIMADYNSGMLLSVMMEKYEMGFAKLRGTIKPKHNKLKRTSYNRDDVIKDYLSGMPVKAIMVRHSIKSYSNVYQIIKSAPKRQKNAKKLWIKSERQVEEPTCPILLKLRERYRNYEVKNIISGYTGNLEPFINVKPRGRYAMLQM